ncbi:hypothetical protein Tco_0323229 [Tanacetum coccineum]
MSRTNSQAEIISEEQLVPRANRLVIKKNNQRVASDSHITNTMLRFMPPLNPNKTYTKLPLEINILEFIKTLGYDEDPETKMLFVAKNGRHKTSSIIKSYSECSQQKSYGKRLSWDTVRLPLHQILWGIIYSANLDFASLIWDKIKMANS